MNLYQLSNILPNLPGLTPLKRTALASFDIHSILHLLFLFPLHYADRRIKGSIADVTKQTESATIWGKISQINEVGLGKKKRLTARLSDHSASIELNWFKYYPNLVQKLRHNDSIIVYGKVQFFRNRPSINHPEVYSELEFQKNKSQLTSIQPEYSSPQAFKKARINSRLIQSWILYLLKHTSLPILTPSVDGIQFDLRQLLKAIHQPSSFDNLDGAIQDLKLLELLEFQLNLQYNRSQLNRIQKDPYKLTRGIVAQFVNNLPFELTNDQLQVLSEIRKEVESGKLIHRLIQGDVGSGKTAVAFACMLMAIEQGKSACLMAPTEILAEQHLKNFLKLTEDLNLRVAFLSGSMTQQRKRIVLENLANGQIDVLIGTHALFQDQVKIQNIDMVIIDEQHRFGVEQRKALQNKGNHPHLILLSATPIPRSLSLALYGDLDVSLIKEKPKGRHPIKTAVRNERDRENVYRFLEQELREGGRIYFVFPLVEESEKVDLKNATDEFQKLKNRFPDAQCGLVHGKMKAEEKEIEMQKFKSGKYQILVSTTVIEVGVDVPEATVMIIEEAERFGLSQLHQLRGRVGRGERASYCILMSRTSSGSASRVRLNILCQSNDGFFIAEKDLEIRGPGDMSGTQQSGLPKFRLASIVEDADILEQAKQYSKAILETDPYLEHESHQSLREYLKLIKEDQNNLSGIG